MTDRRHPLAPPPSPDYQCTLDQCAEVLGVSRERVRQIEGRALLKVRLALERRGIGEREWLDHLHSLRAQDGRPF